MSLIVDIDGHAGIQNRHGAAVHYARTGWPVFPCHGKVPRVTDGFKGATTCLDTIDWWWWKWPSSNVATPVPPGFFVLDVDRHHDGEKSLALLAAGHESLPDTLTVRTPNGGRHLWFTVSGVVRQTAGELGGGLDTRTAGKGYVVLPPSWTSDGVYMWANDAPVSASPKWLVDLLRPVERRVGHLTVRQGGRSDYGRAALASEATRVANTPEGQRNHGLNCAAFRVGQLVTNGIISYDVAASELLDAATRAGLPERESAATISSGLRAGQQYPRSAPA